ncbi:protein chibby homolog 1-like [Limulus polyphemus]|uniref:Protein chibby homolog 1-like n=1 Tax=Limulus polyphemus TaxID=6850 RepID=A0ABM1S9F9_LIMPO|nr:protein chibby homolog 1-like [Limulus polyphemus]
MPLLGNKFSPKRTTPRKSSSLSNITHDLDPAYIQEELGVNYGPIKLQLGNQLAKFVNGQWIIDSKRSNASLKETEELKQQNKQLIEENNLLKYKLEIMLDLLTEKTLELHLQENEIEESTKRRLMEQSKSQSMLNRIK